MARELGVDPSTFSRKMASNGDSFSVGQMQRMVEYLQLTDEEATSIFWLETRKNASCERQVNNERNQGFQAR